MPRMNIDQLKASIPVVPESRASQTYMTSIVRTDAARHRLECSEAAVATLLTVANLDRAVDGFPDRIPLDLPDGRDGALVVRRFEGDIWRIDGTPAMLREMARYGLRGRTSRPVILASVLRVLGIPPSEEAVAKLSETGSFVGMPSSLVHQARALSEYVPGHVLSASLGMCRDLMRALGTEADERHVDEWVFAVTDLGFKPNVPPHPEVPPGIVAAAIRGDQLTLRALLREGGDVGARDKSGRTPFLAALAAGQVDAARFLAGAGADPLAVANDGSGALHCLVEGVRAGHDAGLRETAEFLMSLGCDPKGTDVMQQTAFERLLSVLDELQSGDDHFSGWGRERIDDIVEASTYLCGVSEPVGP